MRLRPDQLNAMEHSGIKVELIGQLEVPVELGGVKPFVHLQETLSGPARLEPNHISRMPFDFTLPKTVIESFEGHLLRVRYRIVAKLLRSGLSAILVNNAYTSSRTLWVERRSDNDNQVAGPTECLVGTDDGSLQVRVSLSNPTNHFTTDQPINGVISFEHVRIPIVSVEVQLVRRESIQDMVESVAIHRQQVIDGVPSSKDTIPFHFMINGNIPQLSSTMPAVPSRQFAIDYTLAIVFIEQGGVRSYFKQLPIILKRQLYNQNGRCLLGLNDPYSL